MFSKFQEKISLWLTIWALYGIAVSFSYTKKKSAAVWTFSDQKHYSDKIKYM